jgi:hypothetical protein
VAYEIGKGDDSIIRMAFAGDIDRVEIEVFHREFDTFSAMDWLQEND